MRLIEKIKEQAKKEIKTIVLPETEDERILRAAKIAQDDGIAKIILVGNLEKTEKIAKEKRIDISNLKFIDIEKSNKLDIYANKLYELRKHKGMTIEKANELILDSVYYGIMMVKCDEADGLVSGAIHSTADTLRPALQIIRTKEGQKLVSAFFIMDVPNCEYGENGILIFSDCALNEKPNIEELSEIAVSSAKSFEKLVQKESKIAMLSYSTQGSKISEETEKVKRATELIKEKYPELKVVGEIQVDAALAPEVAKTKKIQSDIAGKCNTLIFPNIEAGNIGYKLVQKLAKAEAYGPICQGIAKPVNDLSRGCNIEDIVGVIAITAVQAQNK